MTDGGAGGDERARNLELTIDVLIATRARDLVLPCLSHLSRQTLDHTIYLADNGGAQAGISEAVTAAFPEVNVVSFAENQGFGRAVNRLAALGTGDVIVLVNDDMEVEPQFLKELAAPLSDPGIGMCAGLTLQPARHEVVDGFGIEVDCTLLAFNRLRHRHPDATPGVLLGPSGGAAAYRRTAWERANGFDQALFMYAEDLDLALRLRLTGWRAATAADARALHLGGATARRSSDFQRRHAGFGRGFVLRRYGILHTRHAPRAVLIELLTVLKGALADRTLLPLRARVSGWRAAGRGPRLPLPSEGIDYGISLREALRRLRHER